MPLDHYVTLGRSGLRVSPLCLGAMTFGKEWGFGCEPAEAKRIIELSLSDRQLLRYLEYVKVIDEESSRFTKAPDSFKSSPLGNDVKDGIDQPENAEPRTHRRARCAHLGLQESVRSRRVSVASHR